MINDFSHIKSKLEQPSRVLIKAIPIANTNVFYTPGVESYIAFFSTYVVSILLDDLLFYLYYYLNILIMCYML